MDAAWSEKTPEQTGQTQQRRRATSADDDFASDLAKFACGLTIDRLPADVIAAASANLFDTLICAVAGSGARGVGDMRELVGEWGGAPQATILVFSDKVPAHHAAWVNGAMCHARDYDDTHDSAVLHAGVSVVPAALAALEWKFGASGADLIAGVAAGLETICRLGVATSIGIIESGYMYTPLFGHFAATVAAGRVMRLTETEMINALGIIYSQVAGNHQVTRDGALTKRMQPGFAAQSALISVQLAQRGVRGTQATFEGIDGFLRVYLRDSCDPAKLRDGLGESYEFMQLSYKPYPCCRFNHTAIDAALDLKKTHEISPENIRSIRVGVTRQAYEAVCTPKPVRRAPATIVHAQFSIPFTVAAAMTDGYIGLGHFSESAIRRKEILDLAQRVEPCIDGEIERKWSRNVSPAAVTVETVDGRTFKRQVDIPLGNPRRPMLPRDFDAKAEDCFKASAIRFADDAATRLRAVVDSLPVLEDARELVRVLSPLR
ncbi:MmgE/PrpD family protein [Caballeronia sp. GAWG2-1]|uniref:MmgE/PrpD family protein n=1 Tax=Caballeronia sp. GAWG2-1 TaxID=2921744 RepID=UPI002028C4A6|nr:MmgE/PrpD family protein [Caballeronia sp. GAWG2-1]